ncbi:hypothetical protein CapIbe_017479 [Capra ibex]
MAVTERLPQREHSMDTREKPRAPHSEKRSVSHHPSPVLLRWISATYFPTVGGTLSSLASQQSAASMWLSHHGFVRLLQHLKRDVKHGPCSCQPREARLPPTGIVTEGNLGAAPLRRLPGISPSRVETCGWIVWRSSALSPQDLQGGGSF